MVAVGRRTVKVSVDRDLCEGHSLCVELAPTVFDIGDDDLAVWQEHPPESADDDVRAAVRACPRQAISMAEDD
ncbi:ferredoxin [Gordonia rhizosphera]|uniref:Ferredoxin n=1 Tax=Gordonia rhizosphera NBRC 16068 TaxID=1108045 RepID=K6WT96_9ACTN|nr:ferredoxin [Gordonia rhizosphera]GAB89779.1 putative ferredoxin [Gordonia rhizosphera NBRC 16068]